MKIEVRTYAGWTEWLNMHKEIKPQINNGQCSFGELHIIFSSEKGEISCIKLNHFLQNHWEIFCLKGNLFEDTERFKTFEEAQSRAQELLE